MWDLDHKEGWVPKNWCFWTVVLEKTLESSLDIKETKPVNPKVKQPWILIRRTDAEAQILWPPDTKSQLTGKDPDAGKDWGRKTDAGRRRGWQRMRWLYVIMYVSMDMSFSKLQEIVMDLYPSFPGVLQSMREGREVWHAAVHEVARRCTQFSNWTIEVK